MRSAKIIFNIINRAAQAWHTYRTQLRPRREAPSAIIVGTLHKPSRCFTTDLESLLCSMNPTITNSMSISSFLDRKPMNLFSEICLRWYFPATLTPPINRQPLHFAQQGEGSFSSSHYTPSDAKTNPHFCLSFLAHIDSSQSIIC